MNFLRLEIKKNIAAKKTYVFLFGVLLISIIQFLLIRKGYLYSEPLDMFEESMSSFIPMLFPFVICISSNTYYKEFKDSFLQNVFNRNNIGHYLIQKGIYNMIITFIITFIIFILTYLFYICAVPGFHMAAFGGDEVIKSRNTLTILLNFGGYWGYGIFYVLWIAVNGAVYAGFTYLLTLHVKKNLVALSIPVFYYHIGNFIMAVLGKAEWSPLISIFPYSITTQPIYTLFAPFLILFLLCLALLIYTIMKYKEGENYIE